MEIEGTIVVRGGGPAGGGGRSGLVRWLARPLCHRDGAGDEDREATVGGKMGITPESMGGGG